MSKWLQVSLLAVLSLLFASPSFSQSGFATGISWRYTPAGAFPAGGVTITVCTSDATGTPCTPTVSLFADSSLLDPVTNPLSPCTTSPQTGCVDALGNFSFWTDPGTYSYTVTGAGVTSYGPIPIIAEEGVNCAGCILAAPSGPQIINATSSNYPLGIITNGVSADPYTDTLLDVEMYDNSSLSGDYVSSYLETDYSPSAIAATTEMYGFASYEKVTAGVSLDGSTVNAINGSVEFNGSVSDASSTVAGGRFVVALGNVAAPGYLFGVEANYSANSGVTTIPVAFALAASSPSLHSGTTVTLGGGVYIPAQCGSSATFTACYDIYEAANEKNLLGGVQLQDKIYNSTGTVAMGQTLKTGSGAGNYTGAGTSFVAVDTTNLCYSVTVPTGWKLLIHAGGVLESLTAAVVQSVALADAGTTCSSGGVSALAGSERDVTPPASAAFDVNFSTQAIISGDGNAHSVLLVAKTANAADSWGIQNTSAASAPSLVYTLMPSN